MGKKKYKKVGQNEEEKEKERRNKGRPSEERGHGPCNLLSIVALPNLFLKKMIRYDRNSGGACNLCIKAVKWIPVLFIFSVVVWSYYAYVWQLCIVTISSIVEKVLYLIIYHLALIIFVWAWKQTIFTPVGEVPHKFKLTREDVEKLHNATSEQMQRNILEYYAQSLPVTNRTITGMIRYCDKCYHIKPDRAHHCSVCGTCVLKMDHHCPWVNNCVSFTNYKYFILFLAYSFLYCFFIMISTLHYFILFWKGAIDGGAAKFNILFLFFVSTMFATSLISLFLYHCYLVLKNRSTLEAFRAPIFRTGPDKNGFNIGKSKNFKQVFGDSKILWFLPIPTSCGDGLVFPTRNDCEQGYESINHPNSACWCQLSKGNVINTKYQTEQSTFSQY